MPLHSPLGTIAGADDVTLSNPAANDTLLYDTTVQKWKNSPNMAAIAGPVVVWATSATTWETVAAALARCGLSARPAAPARLVFDSVRFSGATAPTEQLTGDTWRKVRDS